MFGNILGFVVSIYTVTLRRLHRIFCGLSAGEVDLPYLRVINNSVQKDTHWTVYYYDQNAYNSLEKAFVDCEILGNFDVQFLESKFFWDI